MYPFMPRGLGLVLFWYLGKVYPVNKQRLKLFHLRSLILFYISILLPLVSTQAVGPPLSGSVQKVGKDTVQGERIPP